MKLSPHAIDRIAEMRVDADEVYAALREPNLSYRGGDSHPPGRRVFVHERLAVVVDGKWIITVLWHGQEGRDGIAGPERADV